MPDFDEFIDSLKIRNFVLIELCAEAKTGITAMNIARTYNEGTKQRPMDWHYASNYLDFLKSADFLEVSGHNTDGMTVYHLKGQTP